MTAFTFGLPFILLGLIVLPVIWWLLRVTPPRPAKEIFPPLRILAKLNKQDQTASKSPWWLVLLRLTIAALIIIGFAQPMWVKDNNFTLGGHNLALLIDNSWPAAPNWQNHRNTAQRLIQDANSKNIPIYILASVEADNSASGPFTGNDALSRLDAIKPTPLAPERTKMAQKLQTIARNNPNLQIVYLLDGLSQDNDKNAFDIITKIPHTALHIFNDNAASWVGLTALNNTSDKMIVSAERSNSNNSENIALFAYDQLGRKIGESTLIFAKNEKTAKADLNLPLEIRNDIAWLRLDNHNYASATFMVDGSYKRRRIAMLSPKTSEMAQPLLSPLYYPAKALAPYNDIIYSKGGDLNQNIKTLLAAKPTILVIGDIAIIPKESEEAIARFINDGGTLLRFAGPNLAASPNNDNLLPVKIRHGERKLGGIMSWEKPQKIAPFPQNNPLASITIPQDIEIKRQILAQPSVDLHDNSWLNLADGTPLITTQERGKGRIIFVHTSPAPDWSNLPLSGFFVDLLREFVTLSYQLPATNDIENDEKSLTPWRILNTDGLLQIPLSNVKPIRINPENKTTPNLDALPGLYGQSDGLYALNLLNSNSKLEAINLPQNQSIQLHSYQLKMTLLLVGLAFALAFLLFIIDSFIMLILNGLSFKRKIIMPVILLLIFFCSTLALISSPHQALAAQNDDIATQNRVEQNKSSLAMLAGSTHLAYVKTGNTTLDTVSQRGLEALSQFIIKRTTIELGSVIGIDLDKDELAFYPLIYWPIDAQTNMPSTKSINKIDAFMHQGGTILFDTRDEITANFSLDNAPSANTHRLQQILTGINIPPLEPQPKNHVIARSYYIMPNFPGRYNGSQLWLEASNNHNANRPVNAGDGVSPILITSNDFAGAWAHNGNGNWMYPLVPDDNMQRVWAFRGGLNIVMYILSGNYKSDQVHVPEILKRLGQ